MVFIEYVEETWQEATIKAKIGIILTSIAALFFCYLSVSFILSALFVLFSTKAGLYLLYTVLFFGGFISLVVLGVHYDEWKRDKNYRHSCTDHSGPG